MPDRDKNSGFANDSLTIRHIAQKFAKTEERSLTTAHIQEKLAKSVPQDGTNNSSNAKSEDPVGQKSNRKN